MNAVSGINRISHSPVAGRAAEQALEAGGDRFKGSGVLCAGPHELSFNDTAQGGRVACNLSVIR